MKKGKSPKSPLGAGRQESKTVSKSGITIQESDRSMIGALTPAKGSSVYPRIERRRLADLAPNENPRRITAEKKAQLKKLLDDLGNLSPMTFNVRTGKLLGGHQRREVLLEAGTAEDSVWCVDLAPGKERAAMLALNTHSGEWDEERLSEFLKGLDGDLDAEFFGLAEMLANEPTKIEKLTVQAPPKFAWVLIGVPIVEFSKVQALLDRLPAAAVIKTTANDGPDENGQP